MGHHERDNGAFTASKQHGHPKCMPLDLRKHPHPPPPSRFVHNTQVKITSSEALQNSQSLVLEAKHISRKFMAKRKVKLWLSTEVTATAWICHRDLGDRRIQRDEEAKTAEMHRDIFIPSAYKQKSPSNILGTVVNDGS